MINPFFNNVRQVGAGAGAGTAITYSAAQQTLHAIHQAMTGDPFFTHVVHHHVIPYHVVHHHVVPYHVTYPTDFSTIPFSTIYYL